MNHNQENDQKNRPHDGGKFANGAITSAFSIMFNDMMHPNIQRLKKIIEKDGKLTFSEAKKWYKLGDGSTINVDIQSLNLDFLAFDYDFESMSCGYKFSFSTIKGGTDQFLVYGTISAKYYGDNNIKLYNDRYDFEQHIKSKEFVRNVETWIGSIVHGKGTPFDIRFNGTYHVTPRNIQMINRIKNLSLNAL